MANVHVHISELSVQPGNHPCELPPCKGSNNMVEPPLIWLPMGHKHVAILKGLLNYILEYHLLSFCSDWNK